MIKQTKKEISTISRVEIVLAYFIKELELYEDVSAACVKENILDKTVSSK